VSRGEPVAELDPAKRLFERRGLGYGDELLGGRERRRGGDGGRMRWEGERGGERRGEGRGRGEEG
jgi:hypothetical protein